MAKWVKVRNRSKGNCDLIQARWCDSYLCHLRGLSFRRSLPDGTGLILVYANESTINATIHMWAVFFPLGIVWLDGDKNIVDCKTARPWGIYAPSKPASYILEAHPSILDAISIGDVLEFLDVSME